MSVRRLRSITLVTFAGVVLMPAIAAAAPILFDASGSLALVQAEVADFRVAIGGVNNVNAPGPLAGGRREINWDGGGSATTASGPTLATFLDIRGALMNTPGTGFVQAPDTGLATQFVNGTYAATFEAFSPQRLFSPIASNITDVTFFIPGSNGAVPATVSAFGSVFSDVDTNSTMMQFFTPGGASLGTFIVPPAAGSETFSFLGVLFDAGELVGRVRITTGQQCPGSERRRRCRRRDDG